VKTVVLLSGGLDSAVVLADVIARGDTPFALTFSYGQRNRRELDMAKALRRHYSVDYAVVDLQSVFRPLKSALTDPSIPVPEGDYSGPSQLATVVPNRNAVFLSVGWAWALSMGAGAVAIGAHAGAQNIYKDSGPAFLSAFEKSMFEANGEGVRLVQPLVNSRKFEVVRRGAELKVPFELTWSCYHSIPEACGRCGPDIQRLEAFRDAGQHDPMAYRDRLFWKTQVPEETAHV
jgi:7-cyano-7-deazaguanine synthase